MHTKRYLTLESTNKNIYKNTTNHERNRELHTFMRVLSREGEKGGVGHDILREGRRSHINTCSVKVSSCDRELRAVQRLPTSTPHEKCVEIKKKSKQSLGLIWALFCCHLVGRKCGIS